MTCSSGMTHYLESATAPLAGDVGWIACPSDNFDISKALVTGNNNFNFWFKSSGETVSTTATSISVTKGNGLRIESPNPVAYNFFGYLLKKISETRFLVAEPYSSVGASNGGAVHLYDEQGSLIRSIYGNGACDTYGGDPNMNCDYDGGSIQVISPDRFVIVSPWGYSYLGKIVLVNAITGDVISTIEGNDSGDVLGSNGVTPLSNGNYVINSGQELIGGIYLGSIRLVDGVTGTVLATHAGDNAWDLNQASIIELNNNKFVLKAALDDISGTTDAGSVKIISSTSGAILGTYTGNNTNDNFGSGGVYQLSNGNIVINSPNDDVGVSKAGSVTLIKESDGSILATITGNNADDYLGLGGIVPLSNGNFAIFSQQDDDGFTNNGTVKIVDGTTGTVLATLSGNANNAQMGRGAKAALDNGFFAFASAYEAVGAIAGAGSVRLVNAVGGVVATISGDNTNDSFGIDHLKKLSNGNFVVVNQYDDVGMTDNGSVKLINGVDGTVIATFTGNNVQDRFGSYGISVVNDGKFFIHSPDDDVGMNNNGSILMIDSAGSILNTFAGSSAMSFLGLSLLSKVDLEDGKMVFIERDGTQGANTMLGSIRILNMTSGAVLETFYGDAANDGQGVNSVIKVGDNLFASFFLGASGAAQAGYVKKIPLN